MGTTGAGTATLGAKIFLAFQSAEIIRRTTFAISAGGPSPPASASSQVRSYSPSDYDNRTRFM